MATDQLSTRSEREGERGLALVQSQWILFRDTEVDPACTDPANFPEPDLNPRTIASCQ